MKSDTDVVIVGGGPAGLAHAIGIKKINSNLRVTVLEKYPTYQREHNLILDYHQLGALMTQIDAMDDPDLLDLLNRLKKNKHIKTNVLEDTFTKVAKRLGVDIVTNAAITTENYDEEVFERNPKLVIGADGAHSVTSQKIFGKDNQVKHEFDYVLQLRFNFEGREKNEKIDISSLFEEMVRYGVIGEERVGLDAITMQFMVTGKEFQELEEYTSKTPLYLLPRSGEKIPEIPKNIRDFIFSYLDKKYQQGTKIDWDTVRISVNEAPATHAKMNYTDYTPEHGASIPVVLVGDAGLGLSYFKGLNAGLQAAAILLGNIKDDLQDSLSHFESLTKALSEYRAWFVGTFTPAKVREVESYSNWQVRAPWKPFKVQEQVY